jgi:hypothetical protein
LASHRKREGEVSEVRPEIPGSAWAGTTKSENYSVVGENKKWVSNLWSSRLSKESIISDNENIKPWALFYLMHVV